MKGLKHLSTATNNQKSTTNPMLVVTIVALMSFMGVLTETSMNVTFPTLERQFQVSLSTVQWVTAGYLLMAALVMLTSAYMKRRFTNRQLFVTSALLFITGDLLCATATIYPVLLIGRLIQAGCVGLCTPLMVNIILDVVPRPKLGTYIGLANVIILIAPALGPTFGGAVVAFASWRMIFWTTLPLAVVLLLLGQGRIKQYAPTQHYAFDWTRFTVLAIAVISLIVGLNQLGNGGWLSFAILLLITIVGLLLFVRLSRHPTRALFELQVFRDPAFLYSFLPYIFLQFANVGINFLVPNYVQEVFGATSLIGGLVLLPGSLFNGLGQPVYGWMLDHLGGKAPLYTGDALFTLALAALAIGGSHMGVLGVTITYMIFAIGRSMAFSNTVAYGLKQMDKAVQNDANALYNTGQQVFGAIGTTVLALMMGMVHHSHVSHAANVAAGSRWAFTMLVALGLINWYLYHRLLTLPHHRVQ
ncbi:major facilitator superfamily permease [Lacticaseibacillus thailandensis DSM 22698 = JCM 13996]|uniref:Major facilitator superfamily permease n=2 Tax=Lacticaseibacillus thailandensis TaxID=381741 RepID=A0A0R2C848_9LACO|nr:major facilitator superfamily permease [Lacticaseibacillus thailandensis DSM 22698 = JCM 13996]